MAYSYKATITIDHTKVSGTGDLSNFPVLISGTYDGTGGEPDLRVTGSGGNVTNSSGYDIIFTSDSAGSTQLDHEIRYYGSTTGQIVMWVRVPTLDGDANTVIYMFYGDSAISTSQENIGGTWESNYKAVWHLGGTGDSSGNSNTLTDGTRGAVTGKIYQGSDFESSSTDYMDATENGTLDITGAFTISVWVNFESTTAGGMYYKCANEQWADVSAKTIDFGWFNNNNVYLAIADGTHAPAASKALTPSTGTWYYMCGTWNGSTGSNALYVYINGVAGTGATSDAATIVTNNVQARLGGKGRTGPNYLFDGIMEEMHIATTTRSADWIVTEYNNQNDPATFYTMGSGTPTGTDIPQIRITRNLLGVGA